MVDVIIPTYQPDDAFCLLLQRLQKQTIAISKLIIANTGQESWKRFASKRPIRKILEESKFPIHVLHVAKEDFDHGGTRRLAVEQSKSDFFVCMTQDALPKSPRLMEHLMRPFQDRNVATVYARQLPTSNATEIEQYARAFNYPDQDRITSMEDVDKLGIKAFFCSNVCAAYRRSIYDALGGFEEHAIFNEDMIYAGHAILAGYKIGYAAKAKVVHSHSYSGLQQFRRNFDLAVSQKQHPEVFEGVKSESEGMRLVLETASHLLELRKPWLLPGLAWSSGCKYFGYLAGQNYEKMSRKNILRATMNSAYWKKEWRNDYGQQ